MKVMLYLYEQMSGLKVNFNKSEVLIIGGDNITVQAYADMFNCKIGSFPLKYLGVPVAASRLHEVDWINM